MARNGPSTIHGRLRSWRSGTRRSTNAAHESDACHAALDMLERVTRSTRNGSARRRLPEPALVPIPESESASIRALHVGNMGSDLRLSIHGDGRQREISPPGWRAKPRFTACDPHGSKNPAGPRGAVRFARDRMPFGEGKTEAESFMRSWRRRRRQKART